MKHNRIAKLNVPPEQADGVNINNALPPQILITSAEYHLAHFSTHPGAPADALRIVRKFREEQPGIYKYVPYMLSPPGPEEIENSIMCAFFRRLCVALKVRFGWLPVLREEDIRAVEKEAKELLKQPRIRAEVEHWATTKIALGIFSCNQEVYGVKIHPSKDRIILRVLCVVMCFTSAYQKNDTPINN